MDASAVDYNAFTQMILQWLAVIVALYLIGVLVLRFSNYYRLRKCPNCSGELKRMQRTSGDRMLQTFSLGMLPVKRYRCYVCYWEGQAFDIRTFRGPKKRKSDKDDEED